MAEKENANSTEQKEPVVVFEAPPVGKNDVKLYIEYLAEGELVTVNTLATALGLTRNTAWRWINKMVKQGKLKKVGKQKIGSWRKAPAFMVIKDGKNKLEPELHKAKPAPVDKKSKKKSAKEDAQKHYKKQDNQTKPEPKNIDGYNFRLAGQLATKAGEVKAAAELSVQVDSDVLESMLVTDLLYSLFLNSLGNKCCV